jgi:hypothetical protein
MVVVQAPPPHRLGHNKYYVSVLEGQRWWAQGNPCLHRDVSLLHGWHLNRGRLLVPPPLTDRQSLRQEMRRRIERLLPTMQHDEVYQREDYRRAFLA